MGSVTAAVRPQCRLAAVNGSIHALVFSVERALQAVGLRTRAETFTREVSDYLDAREPEAHYREILKVARRYVDLA